MIPKTRSIIATVVGVLCLPGSPAFAQVNVAEQVVAPVRQDATYIVSPAGMRVATVTMKGSRHVVLVDNEEGLVPFDQMLQVNGAAFYARGSGIDTRGHLPPVVFSADGKRFAYCGRLGEETVIVVDGKEFARVPHDATALRYGPLSFSPGGRHFYYARRDGNVRVVVNGQDGPDLAVLSGAVFAIAFSSDDSRWAYVGIPNAKRNETVLIVDGKPANYITGQPVVYEQLAFHNDGRLVCVAKTKDGMSLLVEGKPVVTGREIRRVFIAPQGGSLAAILVKPGQHHPVLWLDGREIAGAEGVDDFIFSPDGKRYAALCKRPGQSFPQWVVSDGRKHQEYQSIQNNPDLTLDRTGPKHIQFTADSSKLVYIGRSGNKHFVVINGQESEPGFQSLTRVVLSEKGAQVGYTGQSDTDTPVQRTVVVEGRKYPAPNTIKWNSLTFSPDGSRHAWLVSRVSPDYLFLDGEEQGFNNASFIFSPNGKHVMVVGRPEKENKWGLFVDGKLVHDPKAKDETFLAYRAFSPDSRHLYWTAWTWGRKPNIKWMLYLNGRPVLEFERPHRQFSFAATAYFSGGNTSFDKVPFAWQMEENGVLTFLEDTGDAVKRFRVTPSPDPSLQAMLAALEKPAVATAPAPAAGGDERAHALFNGAWANTQHRYGFKIEGKAGTATHVNTRAYAVGDVILRIESVEGRTFRGQHMFRDGKWNRITGELVDEKTLRLIAPTTRWNMTRTDEPQAPAPPAATAASVEQPKHKPGHVIDKTKDTLDAVDKMRQLFKKR